MTYLDRFQDRDDAAHLREKQQDADAKVREWPHVLYEDAIVTYPHLKGSAEAIREAKRSLLQDQLDWLESERVRLQQESEQLDDQHWTYDDAVEDFAKRFLTWIETKK